MKKKLLMIYLGLCGNKKKAILTYLQYTYLLFW
jgi:hypothetical protein